jgi:hypothetical protein
MLSCVRREVKFKSCLGEFQAEKKKRIIRRKTPAQLLPFIQVCRDKIMSVILYSGLRSRYSDWLRAGRPRGRSSSPGCSKNFLFSRRPDRLWVHPAFCPMCTGGSFPGGKVARA